MFYADDLLVQGVDVIVDDFDSTGARQKGKSVVVASAEKDIVDFFAGSIFEKGSASI
jgi:hypothetical protein